MSPTPNEHTNRPIAPGDPVPQPPGPTPPAPGPTPGDPPIRGEIDADPESVAAALIEAAFAEE